MIASPQRVLAIQRARERERERFWSALHLHKEMASLICLSARKQFRRLLPPVATRRRFVGSTSRKFRSNRYLKFYSPNAPPLIRAAENCFANGRRKMLFSSKVFVSSLLENFSRDNKTPKEQNGRAYLGEYLGDPRVFMGDTRPRGKTGARKRRRRSARLRARIRASAKSRERRNDTRNTVSMRLVRETSARPVIPRSSGTVLSRPECVAVCHYRACTPRGLPRRLFFQKQV